MKNRSLLNPDVLNRKDGVEKHVIVAAIAGVSVAFPFSRPFCPLPFAAFRQFLCVLLFVASYIVALSAGLVVLGGRNLISRLRFCMVAISRNSSSAPPKPLSFNRVKPKCCFM